MTAFVVFYITAALAADTACAESSRDYIDGSCVLQVVANRSASGWRRYNGTLLNALMSPAQHAHGCRWPVTEQHLRLGMAFVEGKLDAPAFCARALWYCGSADPEGTCEARGAVAVGKVRHRFYGRRLRGSPR